MRPATGQGRFWADKGPLLSLGLHFRGKRQEVNMVINS